MIILEFSLLAAIHFFVNFLGDINIKNPPVDKSVIFMDFFPNNSSKSVRNQENLQANHSWGSKSQFH